MYYCGYPVLITCLALCLYLRTVRPPGFAIGAVSSFVLLMGVQV
jgi:hypothetical protein